MSAANLSLETATEPSSAMVEPEDTLSESSPTPNPSSYALKLFENQGIVTHEKNPNLFTAPICVLNILEISTKIATYLLPDPPGSRGGMLLGHGEQTHSDVVTFGLVCTALYCSAMCVLYRRVDFLPSMWYTLADSLGILSYPDHETVSDKERILLLLLKLQYNRMTVYDNPGSPISHRHIPGLQTVGWIDSEYRLPSFLFPDDFADIDHPKCSPPLAISRSLPPWPPFRPDGIWRIELQIHNFLSPVDVHSTARRAMFYDSLQQLRRQCREFFARLDGFKFMICRHPYNMSSHLSRIVLDEIASITLGSGAVPLSTNIPQPPPTLPFAKNRLLNGFREGITINGYISHTPVLAAAGVTAKRTIPSDAYPIVSAHLASSTTGTVLAISCTTNMTAPEISERHTILRILEPALQFIGLQTVIIHLDAISLRLSHTDLITFGETWKNLKTLDLRFKIIITNEHLDIIKVPSVQAMSMPESAELLKRVHLPELDVRNFRNITNHHHNALTSLTSSVLHFNSHEVTDVCVALLTAYPNLETVTGSGSDPAWARFAETLASIQTKVALRRSR